MLWCEFRDPQAAHVCILMKQVVAPGHTRDAALPERGHSLAPALLVTLPVDYNAQAQTACADPAPVMPPVIS